MCVRVCVCVRVYTYIHLYMYIYTAGWLTLEDSLGCHYVLEQTEELLGP